MDHPIEGSADEMWQETTPKKEVDVDQNPENHPIEAKEDEVAKTVEWDLQKKEDEDPDQPKLF